MCIMRLNFRFTVALVVVVAILGLTGAKASAQAVAFSSMNYAPLPAPWPGGFIAPSGQFNPPNGAPGQGQWKVTIDYGVFSNGMFTPYPANTPGIPNESSSAVVSNILGGGLHNWSVAPQFANFGPAGAQ